MFDFKIFKTPDILGSQLKDGRTASDYNLHVVEMRSETGESNIESIAFQYSNRTYFQNTKLGDLSLDIRCISQVEPENFDNFKDIINSNFHLVREVVLIPFYKNISLYEYQHPGSSKESLIAGSSYYINRQKAMSENVNYSSLKRLFALSKKPPTFNIIGDVEGKFLVEVLLSYTTSTIPLLFKPINDIYFYTTQGSTGDFIVDFKYEGSYPLRQEDWPYKYYLKVDRTVVNPTITQDENNRQKGLWRYNGTVNAGSVLEISPVHTLLNGNDVTSSVTMIDTFIHYNHNSLHYEPLRTNMSIVPKSSSVIGGVEFYTLN